MDRQYNSKNDKKKKQKKTKLNMEQHEPYKKPEWTLEDKLLFH